MRLSRGATLAATPITVDDMKAHSVIDTDLDDALLQELVADSIAQVEADTGRTLIETTWTLTGPAFPSRIDLPKPPLIAVDSIVYVDSQGAEQTLSPSAYQVATADVGAYIKPAPGTCWPAVQSGNDSAVVVTFRTGYVRDNGAGGTEGEIPRRARRAALIWAAHLYENRENHVIGITVAELPSYQRLIAGLEVNLI